MSGLPLETGTFVWCRFPRSESPDTPGLEHVVYTMTVARMPNGDAAMVAYTTSRVRPGPLPHGVLRFDMPQAAQMGHAKPFLLHTGRLAILPMSSRYSRISTGQTTASLAALPRASRRR